MSPTLVLATLLAAATPSPAPKDPAADINGPRADARSLSFEAREGTWLSLDLTPDGKTVVFDLLGDLWSVPIEGGAARPLTSGRAWDREPRVAPDGKTIAFVSDRGGLDNLWLMDADGKNPRALTQEKDNALASPAWTPDGQYLIARKQEAKRGGIPPVELWLYHREGGTGIKLTSRDELHSASGAAASPDGRSIYFAVRPGRFSYTPDLSRGLWQIVRYERRTGESFPVTEGIGGGARPLVSPDGKSLAYVSRRDADTVLVRRDLATGAERILARGVTRDEQEGFAQSDLWPGYAFTPDGQALVFSNHGRITRLEIATGALREIPFTAKVELALAPRVAWQEKLESGPVVARILRTLSVSPDGRFLAFDAFGRVFLQPLAGGKPAGEPRRLTADDASLPPREYAPAFSPDGKSLAYVTWSDAEGGHVYRAPVDGGAPVRLTRTAGHYANPEWSPKGDRLSLVRGSGLEWRGRQPEDESAFEIHWLDAQGGDTQYVAAVKTSNWRHFHPRAYWSGDGERLLYRDPVEPKKPTDDPKNELVSVRLDGTDKKRLLRLPALAELAPSPDGQWVAFTSRDNVYLAAVPPLQTKETPEVSIKDGPVPVWRLSENAGSSVAWADGGRALTWTLGRSVYRLGLSAALDFVREERRKAAEKEAQGGKAAEKQKQDGKAEPKKPDELALPKADVFEVRLAQPRPVPEGSFVLRGARVVTMKGPEVLENADVIVTGNRIAAVGPSGTLAVPPGARVFEAAGKTVIPGLIDTHAHLHYSAMEVFPETKWEYAANLAYGVTTVYDPSAPTLDVFAQAEMVEAGLMLGPRVYSSGDVLYGGQQEDIWAQVESQADALRHVRRMKAYGARMIKVYQQQRRDQRLWFAEACRQEHMLLTAEGGGEMATDLSLALDGYTAFEHALPLALGEDAVTLVAKSGTFYSPTLLVAYGGPWGEQYFWQTRNPHDDPRLNRFVPHLSLDVLGRRHIWVQPEEYHFPTVAAGAARVLRAGGNVALGAHGQLQGLGVHWELWAMAGEGGDSSRPGMTPHEALRASTLAAAEKLGFAPELGSIEAGKRADLVVLDADPLQDVKNTEKLRWVVKDGHLYEAETLRQLAPREADPPRMPWQR